MPQEGRVLITPWPSFHALEVSWFSRPGLQNRQHTGASTIPTPRGRLSSFALMTSLRRSSSWGSIDVAAVGLEGIQYVLNALLVGLGPEVPSDLRHDHALAALRRDG